MDRFPEQKLITCITPRGQGPALIRCLVDELGVVSGNFSPGRGVSERQGAFAQEVDILTVVVPTERAEEVFEFLYHRSDLDHSLGRFMFQSPLNAATTFALPELPVEE